MVGVLWRFRHVEPSTCRPVTKNDWRVAAFPNGRKAFLQEYLGSSPKHLPFGTVLGICKPTVEEILGTFFVTLAKSRVRRTVCV